MSKLALVFVAICYFCILSEIKAANVVVAPLNNCGPTRRHRNRQYPGVWTCSGNELFGNTGRSPREFKVTCKHTNNRGTSLVRTSCLVFNPHSNPAYNNNGQQRYYEALLRTICPLVDYNGEIHSKATKVVYAGFPRGVRGAIRRPTGQGPYSIYQIMDLVSNANLVWEKEDVDELVEDGDAQRSEEFVIYRRITFVPFTVYTTEDDWDELDDFVFGGHNDEWKIYPRGMGSC